MQVPASELAGALLPSEVDTELALEDDDSGDLRANDEEGDDTRTQTLPTFPIVIIMVASDSLIHSRVFQIVIWESVSD